MVRSETGPALFYYVKTGRLAGMLALHGDEFNKGVINIMKAKFNLDKRMEDE